MFGGLGTSELSISKVSISELSIAKVGCHKLVTQTDIQFFEFVIAKISKCPKTFLTDCAVICAFLQNRTVFDAFYKLVVDPRLKEAYWATKKNPPNGWDPMRGGALMRAFYNLMQGHGFTPLYGVVLTGPAEGFGTILANKVLFKDLTGPLHGEFTHQLQWLSICMLQECCCNGVVEGGYKFQNRIADIYAKVGGFFIRRYIMETLTQETESSWPGEIRFSQGTANPNSPQYLWGMMVDCFAVVNPKTQKVMVGEDPLLNLYTNSYRCPANITLAIQFGSLMDTFIADYWKIRTTKYSSTFGQKKKWYYPNIYNPAMISKQKTKRTEVWGHTWGISCIRYFPSREQMRQMEQERREREQRVQETLLRIKDMRRKPEWAEPDRDSPPDEWDDGDM